MQCNVLFCSILFAFTTVTTFAQTKNSAPKAIKSDTASTAKPGNLLATNGTGYSHIPLAGEKAYFGDKDEYVNDFVRKYMETNNRTLSSVQSNSSVPFSVIDQILEQKKMPKELKYLAVIESALNHNAVSHAGAVGPWQMMETTAKMMGLSVSRKVDERTDLAKSTTAATKYLDLLYSQLNDWLLVIAAYNSGPTPVQKAIDKTGSHNFWDIKEYLPRETQGHVLAFIATASIFENLSKFISLGSIPVDFKFSKDKEKEEDPAALALAIKEALATKPALAANGAPASTPSATTPAIKKPVFTDEELKNMSILKIDQPIAFEVISAELGIDRKLLNKWNPDYDLFMFKSYPTPFYKLRIPSDKVDIFLQRKDYLIKKTKER